MGRKAEVGGSVVREWAKSDEGQAFIASWAAEKSVDAPTVGLRGKFSEDLIKLFHAANKDKRYVTGHVPTIKVKGMRVTSTGGKVPVQLNATLAEVRAFAQSPEGQALGLKVGDRGRIAQPVFEAFAARPKA